MFTPCQVSYQGLLFLMLVFLSCDYSMCKSASSPSTSPSSSTHHYATQRLGKQIHDPVDDSSSPSTASLPCLKVGTYMRHPKDCSRFYRCVEESTSSSSSDSNINSAILNSNNKTTRYKFQYECPAGLIFDENSQMCNWPSWSSSCQGSGEILHAPRQKFSCPSYGYFQDPHDCQFFYYCSDFGKGSSFEPYEFKCPFDLAFDEEKLLCNWKWLVKGCKEATKPPPDQTPENPAANFAGHLLDGNTGSIQTAGQGLDNDQEDHLEKRSDDLDSADDIEFVDSPSEHRSTETLVSSKNIEGGRRSFARAIKEHITGAIEAASSRVKSLIGIDSTEVKATDGINSTTTVKAINGSSPAVDPKATAIKIAASTDKAEKRQDHLIDPVFLAEESIISNLFAGINPFAALEKSKDRKSSEAGIFKDHKVSGKDHFISIPIIEVAGAARNRKNQRNKNKNKQHLLLDHSLRQPLTQLEEIKLLEQLAASTRPGPRHYTPVPHSLRSTDRPKKASTAELIPVPILTIRQTPKPEFGSQRVRLQEQASVQQIHHQHPHQGIPVTAPVKPHKNQRHQPTIHQRPSPSPHHRGIRPEPEPKQQRDHQESPHQPRVQIIPLPEPEPSKSHPQRQDSSRRPPSPSQRNAVQRPVRPPKPQQRPPSSPVDRIPIERLQVDRVVERPIERQVERPVERLPIELLKQEASRHDRHPIHRHPVPEKVPKPKKSADRIPIERPIERQHQRPVNDRPLVDPRDPYSPHASPSIAFHSREPPPRQNQVHHKRQKNKGAARPAPSSSAIGSIQAQLPPELFANYDIDIKPLAVHPIMSPGGALDFAQLSLVPLNDAGGLGDPIGHHHQLPAARTPKPFGMPAPIGQRSRPKDKNRTRQQANHPKNIPVPRPQSPRKPAPQQHQQPVHHSQHIPHSPVHHHHETAPAAPRPSHPVDHIPIHHQQQPPRQQEEKRPMEVHEIHLEPVRAQRLPVEQPSVVPVESAQEVPLRHHVVEHVIHRDQQPSIQVHPPAQQQQHHQLYHHQQQPQHIQHIHSLLEQQQPVHQQPSAQVYGPQPQPIEHHAHHVVHHQAAPIVPPAPTHSHISHSIDSTTSSPQHPSFASHYQPQASGSQIHSHYQVNALEKSRDNYQQLAPQLHESYSSLNSITKNGFKPISHPSYTSSGQTNYNPSQPVVINSYGSSGISGGLQNSHYQYHYSPSNPTTHNGYGLRQTSTVSPLPSTTLYNSYSSPSGYSYTSSSAEVTSSGEVVGKTSKSSLLIIPVPDPHYKTDSLNDVVRISKDYPQLFPQGFDFSKVASMTRTKSEESPASSVYYESGFGGNKQNETTKSDYIILTINDEVSYGNNLFGKFLSRHLSCGLY